MHGDFTRMEMFTNYYDTFHELMDFISPGYQKNFNEDYKNLKGRDYNCVCFFLIF